MYKILYIGIDPNIQGGKYGHKNAAHAKKWPSGNKTG